MSIKEINPLEEERLGWMAATFESVSDLVFISDLKDRFIYINPAALKKLGYKKNEMIGKTAQIIMSIKNPPSLRRDILEMTREDPVGWEGEVINVTKNGDEYLAHLKTALVRNKRGEAIGMTGISRDITEKMKARQELEKYAKKLEEVNKKLCRTQEQLVRSEKLSAIGILAAGIAHEIGNPLASLSSLIQLFQRRMKDKSVLGELDLMQEHIQRISTIIHKVFDFAKQDQSMLSVVDVCLLLKNTIRLLTLEKKDKKIDIKMALPSDLPFARADTTRLSIVFSNVLSNAWDSFEQEGTIWVEARDVKGKICVTIQDNGKGISKNMLKKVFEPFFTTKEVGKGTGMGLAVSYGIIKSFGGDIRLESMLGKGSKVYLYLRKYQPEEGEK